MRVQEIIRKKRLGFPHDERELRTLLSGYMEGEVADYQMAAWLMAVCCRGMEFEEARIWTDLIWKSGKTLPRLGPTDYRLDKHSTGGVGDKTSLILVPLVQVAFAQLKLDYRLVLPMVSGRALGHTGGTLDKLASVPGFRSNLTWEDANSQLDRINSFMMAQTDEMAPADRKIYALRDATDTVESRGLVVASILGKKFAENLDGLVIDIKVGEGGFFDDAAAAGGLSDWMKKICAQQGIDLAIVLTRMDEPLGTFVGNALEVEECGKFLRGELADAGLLEVVLALAAEMIALASRRQCSAERARELCAEILKAGTAYPKFVEIFEAQGGSWSRFLQDRRRARAKLRVTSFKSPSAGWIEKIPARPFGILVNDLGGGRKKTSDTIDPEVGIEFLKKVGSPVAKGEEIFRIYARGELPRETDLTAYVEVSAQPVVPRSWIEGK